MHIKNLDKLNIKVPIYGFDALGSFLGKKIQGVERRSAAYDAGLRNGQKLLQIFTNKDNSIEVQIKTAKNKIEIIKFNPDLYHNPYYHELNLVYAFNIKNLSLANPPIAIDHKFVWQQLEQIEQITILPEKLKTIIRNSVNQSSPAGK